jgi:hypothetical protein
VDTTICRRALSGSCSVGTALPVEVSTRPGRLRRSSYALCSRVCDCVSAPQANVDRTADPAEWRLDALAAKMVQYCPLLEGLTGVCVWGGGVNKPFMAVQTIYKHLLGCVTEQGSPTASVLYMLCWLLHV